MRKKSDNKVKLNEPNISSSFVSEVKQIIYLGRQKAYASINSAKGSFRNYPRNRQNLYVKCFFLRLIFRGYQKSLFPIQKA
ncbi:hypothetical protein BGX16_0150 [Hallerella succinigenes]|uniref:Uncharacterized protein n=1 Tax=Hallerella succinigenes TaxID=1896222 RepID=A0A2M9A3N4_9BACT|nr:hypothetical protein BGX16_0150 [Hallerella succinigenes]